MQVYSMGAAVRIHRLPVVRCGKALEKRATNAAHRLLRAVFFRFAV